MNEMPRRSPEAEVDAQLDRQADKLGNVTLARIQLGLEEPPTSSSQYPASKVRTGVKASRPRYTGGRSDNEGSDGENDPNWGQTSGGIKSVEQQEVNARGRQFCRDAQAARLDARSQAPATHTQPVLPGLGHQELVVDASWDKIEAEIERENQ